MPITAEERRSRAAAKRANLKAWQDWDAAFDELRTQWYGVAQFIHLDRDDVVVRFPGRESEWSTDWTAKELRSLAEAVDAFNREHPQPAR